MPRLDGERARRKRALHRKTRRKSARKARAAYLETLNPGAARYFTTRSVTQAIKESQ